MNSATVDMDAGVDLNRKTGSLSPADFAGVEIFVIERVLFPNAMHLVVADAFDLAVDNRVVDTITIGIACLANFVGNNARNHIKCV